MSSRHAWRRWLDHPQRAPGRGALFQVHLWLGLAMGAYILLISVSGSAVVFRREITAWLVPRSVPAPVGSPLAGDALEHAITATYPGYEIVAISKPRTPERPIQVTRRRNGERSDRLFDPYAEADMGAAFPLGVRIVEWLVRLHDNLLVGSTGRRANGVASFGVGAVILSGAMLWWPGRRRWRARMLVPRPSRTRRFLWHLHSALGFWSFGLLGVWVVTGIYFGFPQGFDWLTLGSEINGEYVAGRGERALLALIDLHFGRFGGLEIRVLWTLLGLVPSVLLVTGTIVWWRRVVQPALRRRGVRAHEVVE